MKLNHFVLATLLLAGLCCEKAGAQTTVVGNRLDIHGSSNSLTTQPVGAVGDSNTLSGGYSMTIGYHNTISGLAAFAVGQDNVIYGYRSGAVGQGNTVSPTSAMAIGTMNTINNDGNDNGHYSLVVGNLNINTAATSSITVGTGNVVTIAATNSSTLGNGLTNGWGQCLLVGQYNTSAIKITTGPLPLFVVGCGTGTAAPQNAIEVYTSGDVVIPKAQGDILMGAFGN